MMHLSPEMTRLSEGIDLLERLRRLFADMYDAGERDRAWRYLADRFGEFEKAEMPAWEAPTSTTPITRTPDNTFFVGGNP